MLPVAAEAEAAMLCSPRALWKLPQIDAGWTVEAQEAVRVAE